ncbi:MAG: hypothetical protein HXY37_10830 [Chloroflexi bacterium]|nr:hypothetical protein [Chloroflexota bacterium]
MHPIRTLAILASAAVLLLVLTACGAQPVALTAIPVFPEAVELQPGASAAADSMAESLLGAVSADLNGTIRRYRLPADSSWQAVERFYADALEDGGWQAAEELRSVSERFSSTGWLRGTAEREQVLLLSYLPAGADETPLLLVALFSE